MANELKIIQATGKSIYTRIRNLSDQVWNVTTELFEAWSGGNVAQYDWPNYAGSSGGMTELGGLYVADFPTAITLFGQYIIQFVEPVGADPVVGDTIFGYGSLIWTGEKEVTGDMILMGKAYQDKTTGSVVYYGWDNSTMVFEQTPVEDIIKITRTPSIPT